MKIVSLCGSIRKESSNYSILKAVEKYFNGHEYLNLDLSELPFFDPDNQYGDHVPALVTKMRSAIASCDLVVISTPEYAHGIPGILKNGLEWIFCPETGQKSAAIIIGSAQGEWARDQLVEVLTTMDFSTGIDQSLIIHGARVKIDREGNFLDHETQSKFESFCCSLTIF